MSDENPRIEWVQKAGVKCLKFTFKNNLEEQDAINAIAKWRAAFRLKFNEKIILIWDCVEMRGYDIKARNLWQGALKEMKSHIESIWLITNSSLIKVGAKVISVFTSINIKIISSENEIII